MGYPLVVDYGSEGTRLIAESRYNIGYYIPLDSNYNVAPYVRTSDSSPIWLFCKNCRYIVKLPYIAPIAWRTDELGVSPIFPARYSDTVHIAALPTTLTPDMHGHMYISVTPTWKGENYTYNYNHTYTVDVILDRQQLPKGLNYLIMYYFKYYGNDSHGYPKTWWYFTNEDRSKYAGFYVYEDYYGKCKYYFKTHNTSHWICNADTSSKCYMDLDASNAMLTAMEQDRLIWRNGRLGGAWASAYTTKVLTNNDEDIKQSLHDLDTYRYVWIRYPYFSNSAVEKTQTEIWSQVYYLPYNEELSVHVIETTTTNGTLPAYWQPIENNTIDLTLTSLSSNGGETILLYGKQSIPVSNLSGGYASPARIYYNHTSITNYRDIKIDTDSKAIIATTKNADTPISVSSTTSVTTRYLVSQVTTRNAYIPKALAIANNKYPAHIRGNKIHELLNGGLKATNITASAAGKYVYILPITKTEEGIYVPIDSDGNIQPFKRVYANDKVVLIIDASAAFTIYYKADRNISALDADFDYDVPFTADLSTLANAATDSEKVFYSGSKIGHILIANQDSSYIVGYDTQDYTLIAVVKSGEDVQYNQLDVALTDVSGAGDAYIPNTFDGSFATSNNTFVIVSNAAYDSDNSNWNANLYVADTSLNSYSKTTAGNVGAIIQATSTDSQNTHYLIFNAFYIMRGKYDVVFKVEQDITYGDDTIVVANPPTYKSLKGITNKYKSITSGVVYISSEGVPVFINDNVIVPSFGIYNNEIKMGYALGATHVGLSDKHYVDARQFNLLNKNGTSYALPFNGTYAILIKLQGDANVKLYSADYDLHIATLTATSSTIHLSADMSLANGWALLIYDTNTKKLWLTNGTDIQSATYTDMASNGSIVLIIEEIGTDALADIQIAYMPVSISGVELLSSSDLTNTITVGESNSSQVATTLQIAQQNTTNATTIIQIGTENTTNITTAINIVNTADTYLDTNIISQIQADTIFDGLIHTYNYTNTTLDALIRTYGEADTYFDVVLTSFANGETTLDVHAQTYQSLYTYLDTHIVADFFEDKYFDSIIKTSYTTNKLFDTHIIAGIVVNYEVDNIDDVYNSVIANIDNADSIFNNMESDIDNVDSIFNNVETYVDMIDDVETFGYGEDLPYYRVEIPNPTIVLHVFSTQVVKYRILFNNLPIAQLRQGYELNVYMQDLRTGNKYYDWVEVKNNRLHITPLMNGDFLLVFSIKWALNDNTYETIIGKKAVHVYGKLPQNNWGF